MNPEFEDCLRKKRIWEFTRGQAIAVKELETAADDLASAKRSLETGGYKWATIQSYYSMFHSARALL